MAADSEVKYSRGSAKKGVRGKVIAAVAAAAVVCAGVCAVGFYQYQQNRQHNDQVAALLDTDRFYYGVSVQDVNLGGMTMQQAREAVKPKEASAAGDYNITIIYDDLIKTTPGKKWTLTQKDMAFTYDTDSVLQKAYNVGRTGDREERYKEVQGLKAKPQKFSLTAAPDENGLKAKVEKLAAEVNRKPVEPTVVSFDRYSGFTCKDGVNGISVDTAKLWSDVKSIVEDSHSGTVTMQFSSVPFTKTVANVKDNMKKLGTFSTVSVNNEDGTYNMEKALLAANGTCIPAGGTFSFLGTVGSCDKAHGYRVAGVLVNGKHDQDYGGGVCQASTTIYGAALRSGVQIVERYNHAIPSAYCKIGQDATVSYPSLDLKFKNTTDYPLFLVTSASGRKLTATFYGYCPDDYDSIEIVSQVDKTYPAPTTPKYEEDDSLGAGVVRLDQSAKEGFKASAQRVYYKDGRVVKTEFLNTSYYPPEPAYYSRGKGTGASASPQSSPKPSSQAPSSKPSSQAPASKPSSAPSSDKPAA